MGNQVNYVENRIISMIDRHRMTVKVVRKKNRAPDAAEYTIHCQIADYLNMIVKRPHRWTSHEVSNHGFGVAAMINQNKDKRKGVTTGWPDIEIFWKKVIENTVLIFFEVKTATGALTDKQKALHEELRQEGHYVFVVRSVDDVKARLRELGFS